MYLSICGLHPHDSLELQRSLDVMVLVEAGQKPKRKKFNRRSLLHCEGEAAEMYLIVNRSLTTTLARHWSILYGRADTR